MIIIELTESDSDSHTSIVMK